MNNQLCHSQATPVRKKRAKKEDLSVRVDALEMKSAMNTELFFMPTGLGIEGMRKFIKERARK